MVIRSRNLSRCLAVILLIGMASVAVAQSQEESLLVPAVIRLLDEAEAPARSAGVVVSVAVREGERVARGAVLAQLDDVEERLEVVAARIDAQIARQKAADDVPLRYATKAAEVARAELRRSSESIRQFAKSVSQSQIDVERLTADKADLEKERAEQDHRAAGLELHLRKNRLEAAQATLDRRRILAPQDGIVVERLVHPGEWLEPGQKAFRLIRTDRLCAEAFVKASQADESLVGAVVEVGGMRGRVTFVSPEVDPINNQVRVVAEVENPDHQLRPGDRATLTITRPRDDQQPVLTQGGTP